MSPAAARKNATPVHQRFAAGEKPAAASVHQVTKATKTAMNIAMA
jgi:hypothetical protein